MASLPQMTAQNAYQGHEDPFYCKCAFCRKFWVDTFGPLRSFANSAPLQRSVATSSLFRQKGIIKVGDRVVVDGENKGVVKFVGLLHDDELAPKTWVGVKMDENINATNGTFNNKVYFNCPNGHGVLVPYTSVRQLNPPDPRPPLTGNEMFPSFETIKANRRIRLALEEELGSIKLSGKIPDIFKSNLSKSSDGVTSNSPSRPATSQTRQPGNPSFIFTSNKKESQTRQVQALEIQFDRFRLRNEQRRLEQLKAEFGGGERGETLMKTYMKLQLAYDRGRELLSQQQQPSDSNTSSFS